MSHDSASRRRRHSLLSWAAMRRIAGGAALALLLCLPVPPTARADEVALPETGVLDQVASELNRLLADLDRLHVEAKRDPREFEIEAYAAYRGDDWRSRGRVKAKDLVREILGDTEADFKVRERVKDAIIEQASRDPDLSLERSGNRRSERADFSKNPVLKHVLGGRRMDSAGAKLANELLRALWPRNSDPRVGRRFDIQDKDTWKEAKDVWDSWLDDK